MHFEHFINMRSLTVWRQFYLSILKRLPTKVCFNAHAPCSLVDATLGVPSVGIFVDFFAKCVMHALLK